MTKYSKEEFCEVDRYRCLMPIEYELVEQQSGVSTYRKVKCNCHNIREGNCGKGKECAHFLSADEIIKE